MDTRSGVQGLVHNEIFFTEQRVPDVTIVQHIHSEISRQNSNLDEIKDELARQAKSVGGNAVINFKYGQKKHEWWELVFAFKWDTESWHGEGDVTSL